MQFTYIENRNTREKKIIDNTIRNNWTVSDIFNDDHQVSSFKTEKLRLKLAPVLAALAFGENTAFEGFGQRIAEANDISTKSWLCAHLLDEAKHTEGFSKLLNYLYPSYKNQHNKLFKSRDAIVFYGHTHKCSSLIEWLLCTQIAEVFGRQCYKSIYHALKDDCIAEHFLKNILTDEARHIAYINELINYRRNQLGTTGWNDMHDFICKMIQLGRNMFEAKRKGANYKAFMAADIDVTQFCNIAENELKDKFL